MKAILVEHKISDKIIRAGLRDMDISHMEFIKLQMIVFNILLNLMKENISPEEFKKKFQQLPEQASASFLKCYKFAEFFEKEVMKELKENK